MLRSLFVYVLHLTILYLIQPKPLLKSATLCDVPRHGCATASAISLMNAIRRLHCGLFDPLMLSLFPSSTVGIWGRESTGRLATRQYAK